jgi:hypothetical protein
MKSQKTSRPQLMLPQTHLVNMRQIESHRSSALLQQQNPMLPTTQDTLHLHHHQYISHAPETQAHHCTVCSIVIIGKTTFSVKCSSVARTLNNRPKLDNNIITISRPHNHGC